jgi:hypothetical protein
VGDSALQVRTSNVSACTLSFGPGGSPFGFDSKPVVTINGQKVTSSGPSPNTSQRNWILRLYGKIHSFDCGFSTRRAPAIWKSLWRPPGEYTRSSRPRPQDWGHGCGQSEGSDLVSVPDPSARTGLISVMSQVYLDHFALAVDRLNDPVKALDVLERARGRTVADVLSSRERKSTERSEPSCSPIGIGLREP